MMLAVCILSLTISTMGLISLRLRAINCITALCGKVEMNQSKEHTEITIRLAMLVNGLPAKSLARADILYLLNEMNAIYATLNACGIGGIYDELHSPVDAITQMADYIKSFEEEKS